MLVHNDVPDGVGQHLVALVVGVDVVAVRGLWVGGRRVMIDVSTWSSATRLR